MVGLAADTVIRLPFEFRGLFSPLCAVWYVVTEFGSVTENLNKLGAKLPAFLTRGLAMLRTGIEGEAERREKAGEKEPGRDDGERTE